MSEINPDKIIVKKWTEDRTVRDNKSAFTTKGVHNTIRGVLGLTEEYDETPLLVDAQSVDSRRDPGLILNPVFNPGLNISFNGRVVKLGATDVNLAGTVKVSEKEDGTVKIQVGDNMNSSCWHNVDGSTEPDGKASDGYVKNLTEQNVLSNARCPDYTSSPYPYGNWTTGSTVPMTKTTSISFTSNENVHLNDGENRWDIVIYKQTKAANGTISEEEIVNGHFTDTIDIDYNDYVITSSDVGKSVYVNSKPVTLTSANISEYIGKKYNKIAPACNLDASNTLEHHSLTNTITFETGSGVTTNYSNLALEDNYPYAVGARYKRTFNINLNTVIPNGGRIRIVISGCGGIFSQTAFFYLKSATPTIESAAITVNNYTNYKYVSGIKYLTSGTTFTFKANNVANLNNQLNTTSNKFTFSAASGVVTPGAVGAQYFGTIDSSLSTIETASSLLSAGYTDDYNSACTYTNAAVAIASNINLEAASLTVTGVNAFGSAAKSATVGSVLLNTYSTASTDVKEVFQTEGYRLNSTSLAAWSEADKAKSLVDTTTNASATVKGELQVIPGVGLVYPTKDYTNLQPVKTDITNNITTNAKMTYGSCGGDRYFTRKIIKAGSLVGGTITFKHNASFQTYVGSGVILEVSKNNINWFDITKAKSAGGLMEDRSITSSTSWFKFGFTDGDANGWFYFRIKITNAAKATVISEFTYSN